jgi:hypothetical protein
VHCCAELYFQQVEYCCQDSGQDDTEQLEPIEEWDADEFGIREVVKRWIQQDDKGEEEQ